MSEINHPSPRQSEAIIWVKGKLQILKQDGVEREQLVFLPYGTLHDLYTTAVSAVGCFKGKYPREVLETGIRGLVEMELGQDFVVRHNIGTIELTRKIMAHVDQYTGVTKVLGQNYLAATGDVKEPTREELQAQISRSLSPASYTCNFCGERGDKVKYIICGPNVFICNGCVDICNGFISDAEGKQPVKAGAVDEEN